MLSLRNEAAATTRALAVSSARTRTSDGPASISIPSKHVLLRGSHKGIPGTDNNVCLWQATDTIRHCGDAPRLQSSTRSAPATWAAARVSSVGLGSDDDGPASCDSCRNHSHQHRRWERVIASAAIAILLPLCESPHGLQSAAAGPVFPCPRSKAAFIASFRARGPPWTCPQSVAHT